MRVTQKAELEKWIQDGGDVCHAWIFTTDFVGETHIDGGDAIPCGLVVFDVGDNSKCGCYLEQDLCFPTLGFSTVLYHRRKIVFDGGFPHNASTIRKSNPACSCALKRCSIVVFGKRAMARTDKDMKDAMRG